MGRRSSDAARLHELRGAPPRLATTDDLQAAGNPKGAISHARQVSASTKANGRNRINLKAVADACIEAGLDPAVEIARVLTQKVPVRDKMNQIVLDDEGNPVMRDAIDTDTKLRTLNELLQYTQPKLKAVEVKLGGTLELSSDQLDQRLASLIAKANK